METPGLEVLSCYVIIASIAQCYHRLFLYMSTTKLRILKNSENLLGWPTSYGKTQTNSLGSPIIRSLLSSQELAFGRSSTNGSGQCCRIPPSFLEVHPFFCTCSLTQETDCWESLTCFDFLPSVKPKECPGKGREERGKGVNLREGHSSSQGDLPGSGTYSLLHCSLPY